MAQNDRDNVLDALAIALRPIAKILLRLGIGYREFADISKRCFVSVATDEFGLRGRPTNISRVSILTGISRKEVSKIRNNSSFLQTAAVEASPLSSLLHFWSTDPRYIDSLGEPLDLPFESDNPPSFTDLVRMCEKDFPAGAMRSELKRVGAIEETVSGQLRLKTRYYLPRDLSELAVFVFEGAIYSLAQNSCL